MMETLELQGAKLRYHKVGNGPLLILIPGANGTGDIYMPLAKQLRKIYSCSCRSSRIWTK